MGSLMAPVFGTTLGLSLAAAAAALVLPEQPVFDIAPMVQRMLRPAPPLAAVPAQPAAAPLAAAVPAPVVQAAAPRPLPGFAPGPAPVPRAVPDPPAGIDGMLRRAPAGWGTGTGFFVSSQGAILTAAHVVEGCGNVRVMSAHMRPETARIVAIDAPNDVALLQVVGLVSPAWLPVAPPSREAGRLFVLGFPAGALPDTPHETWARFSNAAFGAQAPVETDPVRLVWFRSRDVTHGYSGGPVVDVASGRVVAMSRGVFNDKSMPKLHGVATDGLAVGPGAGPMLAMLSRHTVREGVVPAGMGVEAALDLTRRATVRVVCTK